MMHFLAGIGIAVVFIAGYLGFCCALAAVWRKIR